MSVLRAFPLVVVIAVAGVQGCASEGDDTASDSAAVTGVGDTKTLDASAFLRGLLGGATSPERKASAAALRQVMEVVEKQIPKAADAAKAEDQTFTKRLIGYTSDYLSTGESCAENQKIRVYRGIGSGSQPFLRATAGERKQGVHVAKPMMDAMRSLGLPMPPSGSKGMDALNGVALFDAIVKEKRPLPMRIDSDPAAAKALTDRIKKESDETSVFSAQNDESLSAEKRAAAQKILTDLKDAVQKADFGFSYQFGLNRAFTDFDTEEQRPVNLEWSAIAADHTQGAPWGGGGGSPFSPLISTGIVSIEKWGPIFLIADVCPERAVIATSRVDATEREIYLPLFMLPEEIVAVTTTPEELLQHPPPSAAERPLDAVYRACFDQDVASVDDAMAAYRAVMKKGLPLREFRTEIAKALTSTCTKTSTPAAKCPTGCVASNFCKDKVTSSTAKRVNGLPCVVSGAPGCKTDTCQ